MPTTQIDIPASFRCWPQRFFSCAKTKLLVETATNATTAIPSKTYLAFFMTQLSFGNPNLSKRIDRFSYRSWCLPSHALISSDCVGLTRKQGSRSLSVGSTTHNCLILVQVTRADIRKEINLIKIVSSVLQKKIPKMCSILKESYM